MNQIIKDLQKTSKMAILLSLVLWLITILDKTISNGLINFYIHTPVTYIVIFFLQFTAISQEWNLILRLYQHIKDNFKWKIALKFLWIFIPLGLAILFKNKINEYLFNQNVFGLEYSLLQQLMVLKFLTKSTILLFGSFFVALLCTFFLNTSSKEPSEDKKSKDYFLPILFIFTALFIAVKLYFIFAYSGNYQDDWYHIVTGLNLFQDGTLLKVNQYFEGTGYLRGLYMTALTNFFIFEFGKSVNIAQLAPAFIGVIDFLLLLLLSRKIFKKNIYIITFAILYITNPFIIFNHLFIRFYVFYELFFILILYLLISLYKSLKKHNKKKFLRIGVSLVVLNVFVWIFTGDRSTILFPFYTVAGIFFCIIKQSYIFSYLRKVLKKVFRSKWIMYLIVLISITILTGIFFKWGIPIIGDIFITQTNAGSNRNSLIQTICYTYAPLVLLTIVGFTQLRKYKSSTTELILFLSGIGLIIHITMPYSYQVLRGFGYLWGPLYLSALFCLQDFISVKLFTKHKRLTSIAMFLTFSSAMFFSNWNSYNNSYVTIGPHIVGEVAYYEFDDTFKYININLKDKTIVESSYNVVPDMFYGLSVKYVLNLNQTLDSAYFPEEIKQIKTVEDFEQLDKNSDVCLLLREFSYRDLLDKEFTTYMINHFSIEKIFRGYAIWCER